MRTQEKNKKEKKLKKWKKPEIKSLNKNNTFNGSPAEHSEGPMYATGSL